MVGAAVGAVGFWMHHHHTETHALLSISYGRDGRVRGDLGEFQSVDGPFSDVRTDGRTDGRRTDGVQLYPETYL